MLQCIKNRGRDFGSSCLKNKLLAFPSLLHSFQLFFFFILSFSKASFGEYCGILGKKIKNATVQYRVTEP